MNLEFANRLSDALATLSQAAAVIELAAQQDPNVDPTIVYGAGTILAVAVTELTAIELEMRHARTEVTA